MIRGKKSIQTDRPVRHRLSLSKFRGISQPELSKRLYKLIKTENRAIVGYESVARDRTSIASQLSEWGEMTNDAGLSDLSDKLGVILAEMGEQEDIYAQNLDDYRNELKSIRNTEATVQPARDHKQRIIDELQKQRIKDPNGSKLIQLEQELVRAEAQSLVAEAQLSNVTRQKFKQAYDIQLAATIERSEKQTILACHGRRLLNLLDDSPIVPGGKRTEYNNVNAAREILMDAEREIQSWEANLMPIETHAGNLSSSLIPGVSSNETEEDPVEDEAVNDRTQESIATA